MRGVRNYFGGSSRGEIPPLWLLDRRVYEENAVRPTFFVLSAHTTKTDKFVRVLFLVVVQAGSDAHCLVGVGNDNARPVSHQGEVNRPNKYPVPSRREWVSSFYLM